MPPRVRLPSTPSMLLSFKVKFVLVLWKITKINQKEAGFGPFFWKKRITPLPYTGKVKKIMPCFFYKKMGHSRPLFLYFRLFNTVDSEPIFDKSLLTLGFVPRTSDVGGDRSTTKPQPLPCYSTSHKMEWACFARSLRFIQDKFTVSMDQRALQILSIYRWHCIKGLTTPWGHYTI